MEQAIVRAINGVTDEELWNSTEQLVKKGVYTVAHIPPMLYDWADKNGNITLSRDDKFEYLERAILIRHGDVKKSYEKNPHSLETKNALVEFSKMRESKEYSKSESDIIKQLSKNMVVFDMMKVKIQNENKNESL
jgi:hypothetical protein